MNNEVDFDNYTENYNQLLREGTGFFSSKDEYFARYKVDLVRQMVHSPVKRLLEYGCGIGRNIPFLQEAFPHSVIVGSDISSASLDVARRNNAGVEFLEENKNLECTELFDVVFVAGVFHHVPVSQREDVARTIFNRLSPGGLLFVFEHNPFNPVTRRIVSSCPYDEGVVLIKPSKMKGILEEAGLIVERRAYCLFVPPSFSMLVPLERRLGRVPLGGQYWVHASRPT
jgi:SAM-dependent methyltransferase